MTETPETRLKRLHMRSIRRGIKEMDIVLTAFAHDGLQDLGPGELDLYERLLDESDQDLLTWVIGSAAAPALYDPLLPKIRAAAEGAAQARTT